MRAEIAISAQR